ILLHTARKEFDPLWQVADVLATVFWIPRCDVEPVEQNPSGGRLTSPDEQTCEAGFTSSRWSDQAEDLPRLEIEGDAVQNRTSAWFDLQNDIVDHQSAVRPRHRRQHT